jgi:hypothetical protein
MIQIALHRSYSSFNRVNPNLGGVVKDAGASEHGFERRRGPIVFTASWHRLEADEPNLPLPVLGDAVEETNGRR